MKHRLLIVCLWGAIMSNGLALAGPAEKQAGEILKATGVRSGLVVHIGCGDGRLTAALGEGKGFVVHGLDASAENVGKARAHIQSLGRYGKVSVDRLDGRRLPYADNLATLLVAQDAGAVPKSEIMRVLAPKGVAYIQENGKWVKTVKPWPKEMDEWTHWMHGPDGNAVAKDSLVGPPRRLQWAAKPLWARHHDTVPSMSAMVTASGRIFYISDEAPSGLDGSLPDKWFLVARDAFNGVLLWKLPMPEWGWSAWNADWKGRFNTPPHVPKRLVAAGDKVFVTLNFNAPLTALDGATGEVLHTYAGTDNTDEILYRDGLLILSVNKEARKPDRENKTPVKKSVCVIDAESGKMLWKKGDFTGLQAKYDASEPFGRLEMAVGGDQIFLADSGTLVSLDLKTGEQRWCVERPDYFEQLRMYNIRMSDQSVLVYQDGVVLFAQPLMDKGRSWHTLPGQLHAYSAKDGKQMWEHGYGGWSHNWQPDVFVIDGLVWLHDHIDVEFPKHVPLNQDEIDYAVIGLDLKTGQQKRRFSTSESFNERHHHRCYRGKATEKFLLPSRRGVEFLDIETEDNDLNHWARGGCLYGIMPGNGLLYLVPHPCKCYIEAKLNGYMALAPKRITNSELRIVKEERLEKGPAYGNIPHSALRIPHSKEWPTFRRDPLRSGAAAGAVSKDLEMAWRVGLGGRLSPLVVAGGKVFVASVDEHRVSALDAKNGKTIWSYTAGGRVDTPPTIHKGKVLFGSADGWVYCLRESDGALAWRRQAAPADRLVGAYGQIESAWPVHGSILVKDGVAYFAAGRSTYLDGGIWVYALNPETGDVIESKNLYSADPDTDDMPAPTSEKRVLAGALADILVTDGESVYMRQERVFGEGPDLGHLVSNAGLRDDAWFGRTYWAVGSVAQSQILVFDEGKAYGFSSFQGSRGFAPDPRGNQLFAGQWKKQVPRKPTGEVNAEWEKSRKFEVLWKKPMPGRVRAMAVAGSTLVAAGHPDTIDPRDPLGAFEGRGGGKLWIVSAENGERLAEYDLESPPVLDSLAVADGKVYWTTMDGKVVCMKEAK